MSRPFTITLPIADRRRSHAFYKEGLGLDPVGELTKDGLAEPLQFRLFGEAYLCLIPTEAFGWVMGPRDLAPAERSECLLGMAVADAEQVIAVTEQLERAGGTVVAPPTRQSWGFESLVGDPDGHIWQLYVG